MHHAGCKTRLYRWTSAVQGHPTTEEEEEVASEEEEASMGNTIINPPTASKTTLPLQGTHRTPVSNVDKWDTMPENALKDNDIHKGTGKIKQPT